MVTGLRVALRRGHWLVGSSTRTGTCTTHGWPPPRSWKATIPTQQHSAVTVEDSSDQEP